MTPKRRVAVLAALVIGLGVARGAQAERKSVGYSLSFVRGVRAHVVTANMNDPDVKMTVILASGGIGKSEPFRGMMRRTHPDAAITGTYFGLRDRLPTGSIIIEWNRLHGGFVGTAVAITPFNRVTFVHGRPANDSDWGAYESVIWVGPTLVQSGKIWVDPRAQGFRDPSLFRLRRRTAIGITRSGKLLLVAVNKPIYLSKMAAIMKDLAARDAAALDGGTSTALFYRGDFLARPGRRLTNVIALYSNGRRPSTRAAQSTKPAQPPAL